MCSFNIYVYLNLVRYVVKLVKLIERVIVNLLNFKTVLLYSTATRILDIANVKNIFLKLFIFYKIKSLEVFKFYNYKTRVYK